MATWCMDGQIISSLTASQIGGLLRVSERIYSMPFQR